MRDTAAPTLSSLSLLTLHAVRLTGVATERSVARRFGLPVAVVREQLLDYEAAGWVSRSLITGSTTWHLSTVGRAENERQLRDELTSSGQGPALWSAYASFPRWNERLVGACTRWQLRPLLGSSVGGSDDRRWDDRRWDDRRWDDQVVRELGAVGGYLRRLIPEIAGRLGRFAGYDVRFEQALDRVVRGARRWVDEPGIDSCHTVWFELHEDFVATLGVER